MDWCDSNNHIVSETAHKASVPEDHKPRWESTDRRAFVSEKFRDSMANSLVKACQKELYKSNGPSTFNFGTFIDYCPTRYIGTLRTFRVVSKETFNVVFYGKLNNAYIIWLTRSFPIFDIFGCKRQFNDWTRYEIYISEREMADLIKVENRIQYEVRKFLDTFMSVENEKEEKEMPEKDAKALEEYAMYFKSHIVNDKKFKYKKFIFSGPATIILWEDGTKTVVKCSPDRTFDPYSGVAIAFMKKALGNKNGHRNKKIIKDIEDAIKATVGDQTEIDPDLLQSNSWLQNAINILCDRP